jgi:diketogulonate reductase-like aldo/keto reductase
MPLEKARLHAIVQGRPLPYLAKELDIQTWSAFFLKWVISNPLVTVALPATTNPDHLTENMGALRGPLPDKEMRARMVRTWKRFPASTRSRKWLGTRAKHSGASSVTLNRASVSAHESSESRRLVN